MTSDDRKPGVIPAIGCVARPLLRALTTRNTTAIRGVASLGRVARAGLVRRIEVGAPPNGASAKELFRMRKILRNVNSTPLLLAAFGVAAVIAWQAGRTRVGAQAAVVGQPGVLAAYGFEEGTGTSTLDSTGNNNTGTLSNASFAAAGKFGKAISFNGTSSRVTVADAAVLDLTIGMTLEAWVNPSSLTDWHSVIMKETSNGLAYALYAHDGARPAAYIHVGSTDIDVTGATSLPLNTWSHLAATYDGSNFRLYVNGSQVG